MSDHKDEGNRGTLMDRGERPDNGGATYKGFDHCHFWVSNAKQAAHWYIARFGFAPYAYKGLETGSRDLVTWVIKQNNVILAFSSPLNPDNALAKTMFGEMEKHGDFVKDVAFTVDDATTMYNMAIKRGAESVRAPETLTSPDGELIIASIKTYGDTIHSFVQRSRFAGPFMPGFKTLPADVLTNLTPNVGLDFIDHTVGNQPDKQMNTVVEWYERILKFHRFWTVDDSMIHTEFSSLRSTVVADYDEKIRLPINEPADGKKKSQIQEYVEYHGGPGVQHIALNTRNVIQAVSLMRQRGVEFLRVPSSYYVNLRQRLANSPVKVRESIDELEKLGILVDFDDRGYLLQLFTKPVQDKPTLFFEVIQRENHEGFGAGNFKALFESIEREQAERGNL